MNEPTALRVVVFPLVSGRFSWRLETVKGNHGVAVTSGTEYLTRQSAWQGFKRFQGWYLRSDVSIEAASLEA